MKKFTIYHNPQCSKCRSSLDLLIEARQDVQVVEYLKTPPTTSELDRLLKMLGIEPADFVRKREDRYQELNLEKNPPASREAWLKVLVENPILIERPIVTDGERAVLGRPPEKVEKFLREN